MKKLFILIPFFFFTNLIVSQTPLLEENFNFTGDLSDNGWNIYSGSGGKIDTRDGLVYSGYDLSGIGNSAIVEHTGEDVAKSFTSQSSGTLYTTFMINVISTGTDYVFVLSDASISTLRGRLFIITDGSGDFEFGISQSGADPVSQTDNDYSFNTTYLVTLKYEFIDGVSNDKISLFAFSSSIPSTEPETPTISAVTGNGDLSSLSNIGLRQSSDQPDFYIDGIRVATTWTQSPLPIELVSFSATRDIDNVLLNWQTATEVNNYGFDVERALTSPIQSWKTLGFVEGHGNSNSTKEYEFIDPNPPDGYLEYRLIQIDTDGNYEYFNMTARVDNQITDVNKPPITGLPRKFELSQNFPNPFNPTTLIKYEIPYNGNVELKIFDLLGKEIATVIDEVQNAGTHYAVFNASKLSSGIYIYTLRFGKYYKAKKLTLIY